MVVPEEPLELVLGCVVELDPELELPLALSRRHLSLAAPVSRSQFCVLLPLLEEVLGEALLELLGEDALPEEEVLGVTLEPDEPLEPVLPPMPAANEVAATASNAALTAAVRTFTVIGLLLRRIEEDCGLHRASDVPFPPGRALAAPRGRRPEKRTARCKYFPRLTPGYHPV